MKTYFVEKHTVDHWYIVDVNPKFRHLALSEWCRNYDSDGFYSYWYVLPKFSFSKEEDAIMFKLKFG
jgi:hypothetical protein